MVENDSPKIIGWIIFWFLIITMMLGHYIFNPFLFGFAYTVIYVLSQTNEAVAQSNPELVTKRLVMVGLIALLYMWFFLTNIVDKKAFLRAFDETCYSVRLSKSQERLCENLQNDIYNYLDKQPSDDYYND